MVALAVTYIQKNNTPSIPGVTVGQVNCEQVRAVAASAKGLSKGRENGGSGIPLRAIGCFQASTKNSIARKEIVSL